jgi:hypothetical protein
VLHMACQYDVHAVTGLHWMDPRFVCDKAARSPAQSASGAEPANGSPVSLLVGADAFFEPRVFQITRTST